MPTFKVTDPKTGKQVKITGDKPPTKEELDKIFAQAPKQTEQEGEQGTVEKALEFVLGRSVPFSKQAVQGKLEQQQPGMSKGQAEFALGGPAALSTPEGRTFARETAGPAVDIASLLLAPDLARKYGYTKTGLVTGGAQGLTSPEQQTPTERLLSGVFGSAVGGATGAVFDVGSKAFQYLKSKNVPQSIKRIFSNQILKQNKRDVRLDEKGQSWLTEKFVEKIENGEIKPGDDLSIHNQAKKLLEDAEEELQKFIKSKTVKDTVNINELFNPVDELQKEAALQGNQARVGALQTLKDDLIKAWGNKLNAQQVVEFKRSMTAALSDSNLKKLPEEVAANRAAGQRALGTAAKDWLREEKRYGEKIAPLLDDESVYIQVRDNLADSMKRAQTAPIQTGAGPFSGQNLSILFGRLLTAPFIRTGPLSSGINKIPQAQIPAGTQTSFQNLPPVLQQVIQRNITQGYQELE